jgi:DNA-binding NarL/FixJ family response regulator
VEDAARYALGSSPSPSARASLAAEAPGEAGWDDQALLNAADGPRHEAGAAHRTPSPLTPREHEIVLLIMQGLSNKEIADELVISPATAARHVANILAKLGFTSRTQVASWATRYELPG